MICYDVRKVNSDLEQLPTAIGSVTKKNDRLEVISDGFVLLVADSSVDGLIVDCVASAILSADAFSFGPFCNLS